MIHLDPYKSYFKGPLIFRWRARRHARMLKKLTQKMLKEYEKTPVNTGMWKQLRNKYNERWHRYCSRCYQNARYYPAPQWDGFLRFLEDNRKYIRKSLILKKDRKDERSYIHKSCQK